MRKKIFILSCIFVLAFGLRAFTVSKNPSSLYWDEVSIGYNAYSILQTGKDEWGRNYPVFFEAFNEYKFPLPIYLTAASIRIFGYNDFAVRFPSVIMGSISIIVFYFLMRQLQFKSKIAVIGSFLLSVSMWHIQFSRGLFEANIGLCFGVLTAIFLLKIIEKVTVLRLLFFAIFLSLATYSYSIQIPVTILSSLVFILFAKKNLKEKFTLGLIVTIIFLVIEIPFFWHIKQDGFSRLNQVSIFSENDILKNIINLRLKYGENSKILFNQYSAAAVIFARNMVFHLDPLFLYPGQDGNPRHSTGLGLIYPFELILIALGMVYLFRRDKRRFFCLITLIIFGYVPASLTLDTPHALRSLVVLPFIIMFMIYGVKMFLQRAVSRFALLALYAGFLFIYLNNYYHVYARDSFLWWGGENKLMMEEAKKYSLTDTTVYFSGAFWRPYIYYYYYNHVDPAKVQRYNNSSHFKNVYFGYATFDKEDRRYDYNFNYKSLINRKKLLFIINLDEKKQDDDFLIKHGMSLSKDMYLTVKELTGYKNKFIFSVYEKK